MSPTSPSSSRSEEPVKITRSHAEAEDALWLDLYRRVNAVDTAAVLAEFMRKNPHVQQSRPALALRAAETIRRDELRQQRIKRVAGFIRRCIVRTVTAPSRLFRRASKPAAELMMELIPDAAADVSQYERRVRAFLDDPRFAAIARDVLLSATPVSPARSSEQQATSTEQQVKAA